VSVGAQASGHVQAEGFRGRPTVSCGPAESLAGLRPPAGRTSLAKVGVLGGVGFPRRQVFLGACVSRGRGWCFLGAGHSWRRWNVVLVWRFSRGGEGAWPVLRRLAFPWFLCGPNLCGPWHLLVAFRLLGGRVEEQAQGFLRARGFPTGVRSLRTWDSLGDLRASETHAMRGPTGGP